jgi:hypothetical protein
VRQDAGPATITVTRTGDLSGTVTVRYSAGGGSSVPGVNYTPVSGTLTFNPGEAAKTFTISIANDTLVEGDETVNLTLSNPTGGATITAGPSHAVLTIQDTDGTLTQRFVAQVYLDLLHRQVDGGALAFWSGLVDRGWLSHTQLGQIIEGSGEYRAAEVQAIYQTYLGRAADGGGLSVFVSYLGRAARRKG